MLDCFTESFAWNIETGKQLVARSSPSVDAARQNRDVRETAPAQLPSRSVRSPANLTLYITQYDASAPPRDQLHNDVVKTLERRRHGEKGMPLRICVFIPDVQHRKLRARCDDCFHVCGRNDRARDVGICGKAFERAA